MIMAWLNAHYKEILEIIGAIVGLATLIVKLTPSTKDDSILDRIVKVLVMFSLVNRDGTIDNKETK
jgi:hypothetical protein